MKVNILEGDLKKAIIDLTIPGYFGMLGINIFNIIDTYFVSMLGNSQLAAMSFTFSIIMIVNLITVGLGIGLGTLVSKAVGTNDREDEIHIIMTGLFMSFLLAFTITVIGLLTIDPFFTWLGADETTLPLVKEYMVPWYLGCTFLFVSIVGGQVFRGLGDTKTPGNLMIISALINAVLDPIMIFGFLIFPALGMSGASIATVISRSFTFFTSLYLLHKKYHVIQFKNLDRDRLIDSAKRIFMIGLPNSLTKVVNPLIVTMTTALLAVESQMAVAGYGVGTKIESIIMAFAIALGNTAMAVLGQNIGAGNHERVKAGLKILNRFSVIIFSSLYVIMFFTAPYLARIFTDNQEVIEVVVVYLRILPISYAMQGIYLISTSLYNVLGKPFIATILAFGQLIFIILPFGMLAFRHFGMYGLFTVVMLSYFVLSFCALQINRNLIHD